MARKLSLFGGAALMRFYFKDESHIFVSMLREQLELSSRDDEFVSCEQMHYLDKHVVVEAENERTVRNALLDLKKQLEAMRIEVQAQL